MIHANSAWVELSGHRAEELIGRPYTVTHTDATLRPRLEQAFQQGWQYSGVATFTTAAGLPFEAKTTVSPLRSSSGETAPPNYYVHLLTDINGGGGGGGGGGAAPSDLSALSVGNLAGNSLVAQVVHVHACVYL